LVPIKAVALKRTDHPIAGNRQWELASIGQTWAASAATEPLDVEGLGAHGAVEAVAEEEASTLVRGAPPSPWLRPWQLTWPLPAITPGAI
jgi:hypothetical protein